MSKDTEPEWLQTARRQDANLAKRYGAYGWDKEPEHGEQTRAEDHRHWLLVRYDEQAAEIIRLKQALAMSKTTDTLCLVCAARLTTGEEQAAIHAATREWLDHYLLDFSMGKPWYVNKDAADLLTLIAQTARAHRPDNPTF